MCAMAIEIKPAVINSGEQFGQILKMARVSAGLTQVDLAQALGVTSVLISRRERYDNSLNIDAALVHLAACGYALAVLPATDVL